MRHSFLQCALYFAQRRPLLHSFLITARKRSLGQDIMFTGVCLSTGGVSSRGGVWLVQGVPVSGGEGGGCLVNAC